MHFIKGKSRDVLCRACLTARRDTLVTTRATRKARGRPCRVVTWRDKPSGILANANESVPFWTQASHTATAEISRSDNRPGSCLPRVVQHAAASVVRLFSTGRKLSLRSRYNSSWSSIGPPL